MLKNVTKETWLRTLLLAFALFNQVLTVLGKQPLPISDEQLSQGLSLLLTIVAALSGFWFNNSFTQRAIEADEYLRQMKEEDSSKS